MPINVTARTRVSTPRTEVALFMFDPANDCAWIRALDSSEKLTGGPVGVGTRVRRIAKMLGRPIDYTTEVVELEPSSILRMRTVRGMDMDVTYLLEDIPGGGTLISVRNAGGPGGIGGVLSPLLGLLVNRRVNGDLRALKGLLES
jgi:hypothetical protein